MGISTLPLAPIGATGILCVAVLMLLRGALIPRRVHEDRMADKDAQILYYQTALEREIQRNGELAGQVGTLLEVAHTAEHVFTSLPIAAGRGDGSRDEMASS
jgi:hypothetical protein